MATQAYRNWVADGRPWKVAAPVKQFGDLLRSYGYTVYYLGSDDSSHLQANTPEDHCPFSATGWPVAHPYPYVTACDIMPAAGLPSLQQLGARIVADRNAGVPGTEWLKYANWEPDRDWGGRCWHDSWQPSFVRRDSSDRGHIHLSGRSDKVTAAGPVYDPVARIRGTGTPEEDDMSVRLEWLAHCLEFGLESYPNDPAVPAELRGRPVELVKKVNQLLARPAGQLVLTADDRAALVAGFGPVVEAAVRKVLGGLDGATPGNG